MIENILAKEINLFNYKFSIASWLEASFGIRIL